MKLAIGYLGAIASLMLLPTHSGAAEFCELSDGRQIPTEVPYVYEVMGTGYLLGANVQDPIELHAGPGEGFAAIMSRSAGLFVVTDAQAFDEVGIIEE